MAKPTQIITHTVEGRGRLAVHKWTVANGNATGDGPRVITLDVKKVHAEIHDDILDERYKSKCGDAGAVSRDEKTGLSASPITLAERIAAVATRLETGDREAWNVKRAARTVEVDIGPWLCRALVALGKTPAGAQAAVVGWNPDQKRAMALRPEIAAKITELQRAEVAEIDTDALLADLI